MGDIRPQKLIAKLRPDGAQIVALAVASYDGAPTHRDAWFQAVSAVGSSTYVFAADCRLRGGRVWVGSTARLGDIIKVELLNADDSVMATPVPGVHVTPGGTGTGNFVALDSGQAIPMSWGQKIKFTYTPVDALGSTVDIIALWTEIDGHE